MHYQRFVVISYLRSGTHLLRTALESHPAIRCQTEVFNSDNPRLPYSLNTATEEVLNNWVYNNINPGTTRVGFVLQAYHPNALLAFPGIQANPHWSNIWDLLSAMPELKVIHLRRNNLLKRHLSHIQARTSGQWHNWKAEALNNISLIETLPATHIDRYEVKQHVHRLNPETLELDFKEVENWHSFAEKKLANKASIKLSYENLHLNFDEECRKILSFLGVDSTVKLQSSVRKLESRSLTDSIENYGKLKKRFSGSAWSHFFED